MYDFFPFWSKLHHYMNPYDCIIQSDNLYTSTKCENASNGWQEGHWAALQAGSEASLSNAADVWSTRRMYLWHIKLEPNFVKEYKRQFHGSYTSSRLKSIFIIFFFFLRKDPMKHVYFCLAIFQSPRDQDPIDEEKMYYNADKLPPDGGRISTMMRQETNEEYKEDEEEDWEEEADKLYEWTQDLSVDEVMATPRLSTAATGGIRVWPTIKKFERQMICLIDSTKLWYLYLVNWWIFTEVYTVCDFLGCRLQTDSAILRTAEDLPSLCDRAVCITSN